MADSIYLSPWARNIAPSPTLSLTAKVKAMETAGEDVLGFGAGEPDFDTPDFIKDACKAALDNGETKYAPVPGIPALRKAIARKYTEENKVPNVAADNVVVSPGGKYSCFLAIQAVCGPGDEVIVPAPYWVSYPEMAKLVGATPVIVLAGSDQGFKLTPEQLEGAITERTRMVILNSPSNPTGVVYTEAELRALVDVALKHDLYIMSDEIYEYLLYDDVQFVSPASFSEEAAARTITVGGFSKTFSMTGWRIGTLVAHSTIAKAASNLQSQTTSNSTTFAQFGALAALEHPEKSKAAVAEMLVAFNRRRIALWEALSALPGITCNRAQGAFYLFPNISGTGLTSDEFADRLLAEEKVAVVPGSGFGDDSCVRLSYACADLTIEKGIERLQRFCAKL